MESSAHAEPPCLATVATDRDDCPYMEDQLRQKDTLTEVPVKQAPAASMHPLLLAAACKGSLKELNYLLNWEEAHAQPNMKPSQEFLDLLAAYSSGRCTNQSLAMQRAAADVEEGATMQAPSAAALLEGVTTEGDTVLHVVAAHGGGDDFVSCANLIHGKDKNFLYMQNKKGDTPLHCAARAGKSQMVAHVIDLARVDLRVEDLLRKENNNKETALHEAVRIGDKGIVKELLRADPELACFPTNGTSLMYLAILLKEDNIASTLYADSKNNVLSYSGPHGQNALHAAVLRGTEMRR
uniref:Uncharacterized protein n=1 Tax=Arundo donax TaxID=35708 RepID=A0A0A9DZB2_ARUDO